MRGRRSQGGWSTNFVISDLHSLFLDQRAFQVFLGVLTENPIASVYLNGDLMDFTSISTHVPKIKKLKGGAMAQRFLSECTLEREVQFTKEHILKPLRKAAGRKTRIIYRTAANHEARYTTPERTNTKAMAEIMEIEEKLGVRRGNLGDLLNLAEYDVDTDHSEQFLWNGTLLMVHGERATETAPKGNFMDYKVSGISSHTHRMGVYEERARGTGEKFIWLESGHLRTQDNVEYMSKPPNWQQGYLCVYMHKNGSFEIHRQQIHRYRSIFNGVLYTA